MKIKKLLIACLAGVMLFCGCGKTEEVPLVMVDSEEDVVSYSLVQVTYDDVILTKKMDCIYSQSNSQEVSFNTTGKYVDKVYVEEGDVVKKGDLLCELSSATLEEQIEELDYKVKKNELKLSNYDMNEALDIQDLYAYGMVSQERIDSIKKNYERQRVLTNDALEFDREELARKRKELRDSRLYASLRKTLRDRLQRMVKLS